MANYETTIDVEKFMSMTLMADAGHGAAVIPLGCIITNDDPSDSVYSKTNHT